MSPFSALLCWLRGPLVCSDSLQPSDLIFVLAGPQDRKTYGLKIWQAGWATHLILSTGRFDIRRFAELNLPAWAQLWEMRTNTPPEKRHFFVTYDGSTWQVQRIPVGSFGTLSEIQELARWLDHHPQIHLLLIVSSGPHLRRVQICCRMLLPEQVQYRLIAVPGENRITIREKLERQGESLAQLLSEWAKVALYRIVFMLRRAGRHLNP